MIMLKYAIVFFPNANVMQQKAIKIYFARQHLIREEAFLYGCEKFSPRNGMVVNVS